MLNSSQPTNLFFFGEGEPQEFFISPYKANKMCGTPSTTFTYKLTDLTNKIYNSITSGIKGDFITLDMSKNMVRLSSESRSGAYIVEITGTLPNG